MLVRSALVAVTAAALLPFTAAPGHASCLDDALARPLTDGYSESPKSQYWAGQSYVQQSGTATVTVHGDALASDWLLRVGDSLRWTEIVAGNAVEVTTEFADCVAG